MTTIKVLANSETVTFTHFVLKSGNSSSPREGLHEILICIQIAIKAIRSAISNAHLSHLTGLTTQLNFHGERVNKLDKISHDIFIEMLSQSKFVAFLISEESKDVIVLSNGKEAKYAVCFDPLDGSSNINCLASIGSIFGIYRIEGRNVENVASELKTQNLIAAGYAIYGSATMLVLAMDSDVHGFAYSEEIGEFILTRRNIKIPERGNIYSINEGYEATWSPGIVKYIYAKKHPSPNTPTYKARYVGSMVADAHRTLLYGGIFLYPASKDYPCGKLRLLYECIPLAYIIDKAGGKSSNGQVDILTTNPIEIHDRSPIFFGSTDDVNELLLHINNN